MADSVPIQDPSEGYQGYRRTLGLLGVLYSLGAALVFFFPTEALYLVNILPTVFKLAEPIPNPAERFWLVFASTLLVLLATLSFLASRSPQIRGYAWAHLLAKVTAAAGFGYMFFHDHKYFAYLLGLVCEAAIALLLIWKTFASRRATS